MSLIQSLMQRFGFVRLSQHGLVLTPEGRIISLRPATLHDDTGGRIVGWKDEDRVATELARRAPRLAGPRAVATPVAIPPPADPWAIAARAVALPKPMTIVPPPRSGPPPIPAAALRGPTPTAEAEMEDDWEWQIELARARAAAADAEDPVRLAAAAPPRSELVAPPVTVTNRRAATVREWSRPRDADPVSAPAPGVNPGASIPAPAVMQTSGSMPSPIPPSSPRRFARGTGPQEPMATPAINSSRYAPVPRDIPAPGASVPAAAIAASKPKLPSIKQRMAQ